jgi:recombination protein RecT
MRTDGTNQQSTAKGGEKQDEVKTLQQKIASMAKQFEAALPKAVTPERMLRIVLTAIRKQPELALCNYESFFGAVLTGLQMGLEINTPLGHCYIIAYKREITFQMGYQGILELAWRSNRYRRIDAEVVYEGDKFDYSYGLDAVLRHKPCGKREKPTHVYAMYELVNGGTSFKVWTWDAVIKHAKAYSKSYNASSSPWTSGNVETVESMAKKTMIINALKYGPKSVEIAQAISADEAGVEAKIIEDGQYSFVDLEYKHNQITDDRNNENRVKNEAPAEEAAGKDGKEPEPIPASRGNTKPQPAARAATAGRPQESGAEGGNGNLFNRDEEKAFEEQYEREQMGPDWSAR